MRPRPAPAPACRLDKPVSGLLLFARSAQAAAALCRQIEGREVEKVYVARVLGRFPGEATPAGGVPGRDPPSAAGSTRVISSYAPILSWPTVGTRLLPQFPPAPATCDVAL